MPGAGAFEAPCVASGLKKKKPCDLTRLQICPLYIFGNKATDGTYGSKYWFPGFGLDSGTNLQPCLINHKLRSCNDCSDVVVQAF